MKRVFLIVLDSLGIGAAPDAHEFGDTGTNTLKRISKSKHFKADNLLNMGLGSIDGVDYLKKSEFPTAAHGRLSEISRGKDTTIGHWEICGIVSKNPLPTYPNGFPDEIITEFEKQTKRGVLCNKPYSGTDAIRDFGKEHVESGKLIVYTSADSVFQIAAHEDTVTVDELYEYCRIARRILVGKHGVGRVIARPFVTDGNGFKRTSNRRDFSLLPPKPTLLDTIKGSKLDVIAVGKIEDIFASQGITEAYHTGSNEEGMELAYSLTERDFSGLAFINLVDFDSKYGHRQDTDGYASALSRFDTWLGKFKDKLSYDDMLIITADHGCDPGDDDTDHTREYVPLLVYGKDIKPMNLGTKRGFGAISDLVARALGIDFTPDTCELINKNIL